MSLVGLEKHHYVLFHLTVDSDDLRTANIIADEQEGVTCLVIDRETFNQLISSLDEIRTRYKDEGVERRRWVTLSCDVFIICDCRYVTVTLLYVTADMWQWLCYMWLQLHDSDELLLCVCVCVRACARVWEREWVSEWVSEWLIDCRHMALPNLFVCHVCCAWVWTHYTVVANLKTYIQYMSHKQQQSHLAGNWFRLYIQPSRDCAWLKNIKEIYATYHYQEW